MKPWSLHMAVAVSGSVAVLGFHALGVPVLSPACAREGLGDQAPYLQALSSDSVVILSHSTTPCRAEIRFGTDQLLDNVVREETERRVHAFRLEGLLPRARYFYRVAHQGLIEWPPASFETYPPAGFGGEVTLAVLGDSGINDSAVPMVLAEMLREERPHAVLHTGDVQFVFGSPRSLEVQFFGAFGSLLSETCVFPVRGNHDIDVGESGWRDAFATPERRDESGAAYSFDVGDAHVVALDSSAAGAEGCAASPFDDEVLAWVDRDLGRDSHAWSIVYFHHPPYSTISHGSTLCVNNLLPVLDRHGVDLVLSGHSHGYERFYPIRGGRARDGFQDPEYVLPSGTIYVVTAGGGSTLGGLLETPEKSLSASRRERHHILILRVSQDLLVIEARGVDGEVFDRSTVSRKTPKPMLRFLRGDANESGEVGLPDAVAILGHLFLGGPEPCRAASDANGSGTVDVSDAIHVICFLFVGGPPPPSPFPDCGSAEDALDWGCTRSCP